MARQRRQLSPELKTKREAFIAFIRNEDADREPWARYSLRQHWSGPEDGFHDHQLQQRWRDFAAGWDARQEKEGKHVQL